MQSQNPWIGTFLIVGVGTLLGVGFNALQPKPLPWIGRPVPVTTLEGAGGEQDSGTPTQPTIESPLAGSDSTNLLSGGMTIQSTSPSAASTSPSATSPRGGLSTEPAPVAVAPLRDPVAPAEEKLPAIAAANAFADIPESEYPIEIHLEKAKEFYDRGGLLILDAREPEEFAEGHIRGALSAPTNERLSDLEWVDRTAKDTRPILVYCGGGECELSLELGFEINRAGHRRVLVFKEGYPAWKEAGYPVEESTP